MTLLVITGILYVGCLFDLVYWYLNYKIKTEKNQKKLSELIFNFELPKEKFNKEDWESSKFYINKKNIANIENYT